MARTGRRKQLTWLVAAAQVAVAQFAVAPATALQILEATDHAELSAEVSSSEVNRIALEGDRISRVVQSGGGFTLEHDPVRGDLYLYPRGPGGSGLSAAAPGSRAPEGLRGQAPGGAAAPGRAPAPGRVQAPVTLYVGSEKGLTYRLTLTPVARASAQILIRSAAAAGAGGASPAASGGTRASEIAALVAAVARREPLPSYAVVAAAHIGERQVDDPESESNMHERPHGIRPIEIWRGPRFTARVFQVSDADIGDASELAAVHGRDAVAAWLSGAAHGSAADSRSANGGGAHGSAAPANTRLGVIVEANSSFGAAP